MSIGGKGVVISLLILKTYCPYRYNCVSLGKSRQLKLIYDEFRPNANTERSNIFKFNH